MSNKGFSSIFFDENGKLKPMPREGQQRTTGSGSKVRLLPPMPKVFPGPPITPLRLNPGDSKISSKSQRESRQPPKQFPGPPLVPLVKPEDLKPKTQPHSRQALFKDEVSAFKKPNELAKSINALRLQKTPKTSTKSTDQEPPIPTVIVTGTDGILTTHNHINGEKTPEAQPLQKTPDSANSDQEFEGLEEAIEKEESTTKAELTAIFKEMKVVALETEKVFKVVEDCFHNMNALKKQMTQLFDKAEDLISHDKENKTPAKKSINKNNKTPVRKCVDLRKNVLNKTVVNVVTASPRTRGAVDLYNSIRENCHILCTPRLEKTMVNVNDTPKSMTLALSKRVQSQCLMLQDTPKPK